MPRARWLALPALAVLLLLVLPAQPALACSCAIDDSVDVFRDPDRAVAVVERVDNGATSEMRLVLVEQLSAPALPGQWSTPVGDGASCGLFVPPGGLVALLVDPDEPGEAGLCSTLDLATVLQRVDAEPSIGPVVAVFGTWAGGPAGPHLGTVGADGRIGELVDLGADVTLSVGIAACGADTVATAVVEGETAFVDLRAVDDLEGSLARAPAAPQGAAGAWYVVDLVCDATGAHAVVTLGDEDATLLDLAPNGGVTRTPLPHGGRLVPDGAGGLLVLSSGIDGGPPALAAVSAERKVRAVGALPPVEVQDVARDRDGSLLVSVYDTGAGSAGLLRIDPDDATIIDEADHELYQLTSTRDGVLAIGPGEWTDPGVVVAVGDDLSVDPRATATGSSLAATDGGVLVTTGQSRMVVVGPGGEVTRSPDLRTAMAGELVLLEGARFDGVSAAAPSPDTGRVATIAVALAVTTALVGAVFVVVLARRHRER